MRRNPQCTPPMPSINNNLGFSSCRSFEPILRLLPQGISPVSQHWATWALYNLVSVYREYPLAPCSLIGVDPGGSAPRYLHPHPLCFLASVGHSAAWLAPASSAEVGLADEPAHPKTPHTQLS